MKTTFMNDDRGGGRRLVFWCPACEMIHAPRIERGPHSPDGPVWEWNGDRELPTLTPSVRTYSGAMEAGRQASCHLQLTDGKLSYYTDSFKMPGRVVDLPHLPPGCM